MPTNAPTVDAVCWDWNGTLLDDVDIARAAMNAVLEERRLPVLSDQHAYRNAFAFPIKGFYARLGITDADFRLAASRYLELFAAQIGQAQLQAEARATLAAISSLGLKQVLISATIESTLRQQLAPHNVAGHFTHILGIADAYAASKADVVAGWLETSGHDPRRVLMIGDTNHDEEIAEDLNVRFLRFARGHQQPPNHNRHPVLHQIRDVIEHIHEAHRTAR
ncbi:HAD family hydrolase [Sinomonas terrae]|uniref:HAD hydrolase-like protein n=1 Tax=Sinomonas terrae TaxID=2908838 RepID=A0ABS9TW64_9MICC|nr:HAD hydrolase-like protein [Sinomonas terrae]MCH6468620.1 HAD hydrolase-like protein [Sinomonas terrae]